MPKNSSKITLLITISLPWLLSLFLAHHPVMSFLIAFFGSLFIFYASILSPWRCIDNDRPLAQQLMRPIILLQLIFAGYMCCTSIFYFADHLGFEYLYDKRYDNFHITEQTYLLARSQRIALLGHFALVTGMVSLQQPKLIPKYQVRLPIARLLVKLSLAIMVIAAIFTYLPALLQFKYYLMAIAVTAQAFLVIYGLSKKKPFYFLFGALFFGLHLLNATLSGYKEILLINVITITFMAFPHFRKLTAILFVPVLLLMMYILPTLTAIVRKESWTGNKTPQEARADAYEVFASGRNEALITVNNWEFLTNRFSEIGMFCQYIKNTPAQRPFYGMEILKNSFYALIPRAIWLQKPNTEKLSMERVYKAGVVNRLSPVSAKTRTVIDGYLSAGLWGVFLTMLLYGIIVQWLCNKAEQLFGGYQLGCMIVFNGIFQPLWRGNNLEFIINNMVYGFLTMVLLFYILRHFKILTATTPEKFKHSII